MNKFIYLTYYDSSNFLFNSVSKTTVKNPPKLKS